jgi:serine phosphatase RsbU (regulator of sigma subunit)
MREMERELAAAARIQKRLLPATPPEIPGYELAGVNIPCREVGGDYFDYLARGEGRLAIALGDVSGKGIGGALLMAMLQACFRAQAGLDIPLSEVVARINNVVFTHSDPERFITFFCCELDSASGELTCVNAGHNPPLLFRADGIVKEVRHPQLILGIRPDLSYAARDLVLQSGDLLVLYSDGVTESRRPDGREFEVGGLVRTVKKNLGRPVAAIRDAIVTAARSFAGSAEQADDLTVSLIRRL